MGIAEISLHYCKMSKSHSVLQENNNHGSSFDEFQLLQVLIDIFLAAVDTATNTLLFGVFYMVK